MLHQMVIKKSDARQELEPRGTKIWSANALHAFLGGRGLRDYREGDVGPLYLFALRHFGAKYAG